MVGALLAPVFQLFILMGAVKMRQLESWSSARTAAILAVIPICSPCVLLGIPFGIWALIVLNNPQVRSEFRS